LNAGSRRDHECLVRDKSKLEGKGGVYRMNVDIAPVLPNFSLEGTSQILNGVLPWAIDPDLASRLWRLREQLTGTTFMN
jgi:hypothetical protein